MHLIIYGPEGSGKGTQAELLSRFLKIPIYTSGDLVREAAYKDKGELGKTCRAALENGRYVPDRQMFSLWQKKLSQRDAQKGFILDGFPRNINQARYLFNELEKHQYSIDKVIYLRISDRESEKRLKKRKRKLFSGSTKLHYSLSRIQQRLRIYHQQEKQLLDFFQKKNLLLTVEGKGSVDEVFERIKKVFRFK